MITKERKKEKSRGERVKYIIYTYIGSNNKF